MSVSIRDIDNDNASFSEGTLTDVVAVNDGLELANNPALSFDGENQNILVDATYDFPALTYESWIFYDINQIFSWPRWFGVDREKENHSDTEMNSEDYFCRFRYAGDEVDSDNNFIIPNELHHYAVTYNLSTVKFYRDGILFNEKTMSATPTSMTIHTICNIDLDRELTLIGLIDDVRVWNTTRTQTEIQNNMNKELTGNETGLVAYYKMNEGSGSTLKDYAGTNDGIINGATWTVDTNRYLTQGSRQSPQLDLSAVNDVASSSISWTEALNSQTITIETSVDGGSNWDTPTNGGSIPNISGADTLDVRQTLSTTDTTVTPVLESLTIDIDTAETNEDSGSFTATLEQEDFKVVEEDNTQLTSAEDSELAGFSFNDSGTFNIDAENWYTMVWEVFVEDSITSKREYTQKGWITNPYATESWQKADKPESGLWTKIDKPTSEWREE